MLECFTWIPHLLCSSINSMISQKGGFGPLPDDVLIDILSRLPVDSILQCRKVCKHWRVLTSLSYFVTLQHGRGPSRILMQCCHQWWTVSPKLHFSVFDEHAKKWKRTYFKSQTNLGKHNPFLIGSCGALLIFRARPPKEFYTYDFVLNLITQEQKFITRSNGFVCGLYSYPLASELKFLTVDFLSDCYQYYIYIFTSHVRRKIGSTCYFVRPAFDTFPAVVNLALHWIVAPDDIKRTDGIDPCMHAIMEFNIESEQLCTMPHPRIGRCDARGSHYMMHLFVKDNCLSLCHCRDYYYGNIDIWILEDYVNWHWVKRYSLCICPDGIDRSMRFYVDFANTFQLEGMKVLNVSKDELLIQWFSGEPFLIDLTRCTVKKIGVPHYKSDHLPYSLRQSGARIVAYTSSVATPSLISIGLGCV